MTYCLIVLWSKEEIPHQPLSKQFTGLFCSAEWDDIELKYHLNHSSTYRLIVLTPYSQKKKSRVVARNEIRKLILF